MTKKVETRGRPEKPQKEKRSVVVQFRCTTDEKKLLDMAAKKSGQKLSDWLRENVLLAI